MKLKLSIIVALATILCLPKVSFAQTTTPIASTNNPVANWVDSPVVGFLSNGSNWVFATYGIWDKTTHSFGGGIAAGYKLSEFVVPYMRLDYINKGAYVPSGSLQLQVPIKLLGKFTVVPFTSAGAAVTLGNNTQSGVVGIFAAGGILELPQNTKWYVPKYVLADYERWTGGGFNDNQYRFGVGYRF